MRRRKKLFTMDDHPVEVFRQGKKRLFVDSITGMPVMHNPSPLKSLTERYRKGRAAGKKKQEESNRKVREALSGTYAEELLSQLPGSQFSKSSSGPHSEEPTTSRGHLSSFEKAVLLEQLECGRRREHEQKI